MDDLKLYSDTDANLRKLVKVVADFSKDVGMEFGLDKCSKCTLKKGRKAEGGDIDTDEGGVIRDLAQDGSYKNLGIEENATCLLYTSDAADE